MTAETPPPGRIVTFYSYKGGTGRSMALANVAWILASQGRRVLVIDWDLEAPGLHRYFHPFIADKELIKSPGLIDFLIEFSEGARGSVETDDAWFESYTDLEPYTFSLDWDFPGNGTIDFAPAGQQGAGYGVRVMGFDWVGFYDKLGGGVFLEAVKQRLRLRYDWVLIDSRTGLSDTSGLCTVQMPDDLVVCFTLNHQSISGAAAVTESAFTQRIKPSGEPGLRVWPIPTRVELAEKDRLELARDAAHITFQKYLLHLPRHDRQWYWGSIEVPYVPSYAYEEVLATFADRPRTKLSVLSAMEALTERLTDGAVRELAPIPESRRIEVLAKFTRVQSGYRKAPTKTVPHFFLSYGREDSELGRRLGGQLNENLEGHARVVWQDVLIKPGDRWRDVLAGALEAASALLLLVTPARLSRTYSGQSDVELGLAIHNQLRIVPILANVSFDDLSASKLRYLVEYQGISIQGSRREDLRTVADALLHLLSLTVSAEDATPIDADDPQRGLWGGTPSRNGRLLTARVSPVDGSTAWFRIDLTVSGSPGLPLVGEVDFHLHPTFSPAMHRVTAKDGVARLLLRAWGAFTVGAVTDAGQTKLELNLAELADAPRVFRER